MKNTPLVSVHMVTYNHAPYIERAVTSVLEQETDFSFELVIGEDCSTDGTREIVQAFQKRQPDRVRVITSRENVGMHNNVRRTNAACTGKYVAYCDGDDYWRSRQKLQSQVAVAERQPDVSLVFGDSLIYNVTRNEWDPTPNASLPTMSLPGGRERFRSILLNHPPRIFTATVLVRNALLREVIQEHPAVFEESRFPMLDHPTWLGLAWKGNFHYIGQPLATYNILAESASNSASIVKRVRFTKGVCEMKEYFLQKYAEEPSFAVRVRKDMYRRLLWYACKARQPEMTEWAFAQMRRTRCPITTMDWLYGKGAHFLPLWIMLCAYRGVRSRLAKTRLQRLAHPPPWPGADKLPGKL